MLQHQTPKPANLIQEVRKYWVVYPVFLNLGCYLANRFIVFVPKFLPKLQYGFSIDSFYCNYNDFPGKIGLEIALGFRNLATTIWAINNQISDCPTDLALAETSGRCGYTFTSKYTIGGTHKAKLSDTFFLNWGIFYRFPTLKFFSWKLAFKIRFSPLSVIPVSKGKNLKLDFFTNVVEWRWERLFVPSLKLGFVISKGNINYTFAYEIPLISNLELKDFDFITNL